MAEINLKTGQENNIPSTKKEGTVYFTVDTINNIGKIFFDHSSSTRVNIVPDRVDCGTWNVINLGYNNSNCCFIAGTKILCDFEGTTKCIEDIIAGDRIISYNIFSKEFYLHSLQAQDSI